MGINVSELNHSEFMEYMFRLRGKSTARGFTDKSQMEASFLPYFEKIVGKDKPSVTEYGSGVPLLSLFLAAQGKIDKIFAIETDEAVLQELEYIISETKLPVEIIRNNINIMDEFPETDVGISINCLYGYAPTFIQGATGVSLDQLPTINIPILKLSNHKRFGLFRYMNNNMPWELADTAVSEMNTTFSRTEIVSGTIKGQIRGCQKMGNDAVELPSQRALWGGYILLGYDKKQQEERM